jgi:hypothetical protein
MRWHRDYDGGYPPLASDVMPEERDEDGGGYDSAAHVEHLRDALSHCEECAKHLRRAIDLIGDNAPSNPEAEAKRRRTALYRRSLRWARASNI